MVQFSLNVEQCTVLKKKKKKKKISEAMVCYFDLFFQRTGNERQQILLFGKQLRNFLQREFLPIPKYRKAEHGENSPQWKPIQKQLNAHKLKVTRITARRKLTQTLVSQPEEKEKN